METITVEQYHAALKAQGVPREHLAFKCPICKTIQSMQDLINAGTGPDMDSVETFIGFSCVGRWTGAGGHDPKTPPGRGCDWTLGGLLRFHKLVVITEDEKENPMFELATPEEAQAHMAQLQATA